MSVAHRWGRYTKYLSIACLSLAILSTLVLNIVSSYSSSKIESNAIDGNTSTLANDSSSISLSFSNATGSCSDTSNPANVCMSIPDDGEIATGGHTVTVNAGNDIASYGLKLSSKTEETALVNEDKGSNATTIEPITKTYTSVQDLDGFKNVLLSYASDNTWAYFVISEGTSSFGFVSPMTPASKPKTILDSSATTNTNNSINIYYGARVDHPSTMLAGNYTTQVVYTVTATLHEPTIASIDPSTYELASNEGLDSTNRLPVTIAGNYLSSTSRVYLTNSNTAASNAGTEYNCTNIQVANDGNSLTCTLPTDKTNSDLEAGTYNLAVLAGNGTAVLDNAFTYTKPSICRNGDPDSDCQVDIDDNMFPVAYDESAHSWYLVSKSSMERGYGSWYDYGDRKWANAVTMPDNLDEYCYYANKGGGTYKVTSARGGGPCDYPDRYDIKTPFELASAYFNGEDIDCSTGNITMAGTCYISDFSALGFWVYIPRYAYQVQRKEVRDHYVSDALASSNGGFNIRFETASDFKKEPAETCSTDSNNMFYTDMTGMENEPDYVGSCHTRTDYPTREEDYNQTAWATHPAFSWLDSNGDGPELNGFWIGKFETTGSTEQPTVLPNEKHLSAADNGIGDYYDIAQSIGAEDKNNVYGNSSQTSYNNGKGYHSLNTTTSHMLKNSEWGAAAYLSASRYGAGVNGVQINANTSSGVDSNNGPSYGVTGYGPNGSSAYYTDNGQLASTTNNIYGVYDMAGGAWEYVMGSSSSNIFQSITNIHLSIAVKPPYTDLYAYSPFNGDRFTNNNLCTWATCGGHALYETKNVQSIPANGDRASWNSDYSEFVHAAGTWFARGGHAADNFRAGTFASSNDNGHVYNLLGFRVALLPNMNSGGSTVPSEITVTNVDPASISIAKLAMGDPLYFYLNGNNLTKLSRVVLTGVQYPDLTQELSCHADSDTQAECYIRQWNGSNGYPAQDYSATFYGYNDEILYTMDVFVSVTGQMG